MQAAELLLQEKASLRYAPIGHHLDGTGVYESQQRANRRLGEVVPVTLLLMSKIGTLVGSESRNA